MAVTSPAAVRAAVERGRVAQQEWAKSDWYALAWQPDELPKAGWLIHISALLRHFLLRCVGRLCLLLLACT